MIKRRRTKTAKVAHIRLGSRYPVVIQSMTNVFTTDVDKCIEQVSRLSAAECGLVRIAVPRKADTAAFAKIVNAVDVPLVADVHFSAARAIEAIEAGTAKIRLNPGNIKKRTDILRIIDAARSHKIAIRIGVNEASIRDLAADVAFEKRAALMVREMKKYVRIFEGRGFDNLVLSAKSSDAVRTIEVNRRIASAFDYPIHIGLTHAGLPEDAAIPSAIALGSLLAEGIGDTIRVSLAGDPVAEVEMAKEILASLGLYERGGLQLIVCPTCGRSEIDVVKLARRVRSAVAGIDKPLRIAVMGCVVNGPGEAKDADLAVCGGKEKAFIYRKGRRVAVASEKKITEVLVKELKKL